MDVSFAQQASLPCPKCGERFVVDAWLIVDTATRPDLVERIRNGTLHTLCCPHCGPQGAIDAPLLLYRPSEDPALLYSPAQSTNPKQDQEQAGGLLNLLRERLGSDWRDEWIAEGLPAVPHSLLPATLELGLEKARQQAQRDAQQTQDRAEAVRRTLDSLSPVERAQAILERILAREHIALEPSDLDDNLFHALAKIRAEALPGSERAEALSRLEQWLRTCARQVESSGVPESRPWIRSLMGAGDLGQVLIAFGDTSSWDERRRVLEAHPELISAEVDNLLKALTEAAQQEGDAYSGQVFSSLRAFLQQCRQEGMEEALLRAPTPATVDIEVPLQFQAEISEVRELLHCFFRQNDRVALDCAIVVLERILLHPVFATSSERFRSGILCDTGATLLSRYRLGGLQADLDRALALLHTAVELTPPGTPNRPGCLDNLCTGLRARYRHTGALADLEEALRTQREALELVLPNDPDRPMYLDNLGIGLRTRYRHTGVLANLEEALRAHREALDLVLPGDPALYTYLNNLGGGLGEHYERTRALVDLEEALQVHRRGINLTSPDNPSRASLLNNLGNVLLRCYLHTNLPGNLDEALQAYLEAVDLTPRKDPDRSVYLDNLGVVLSTRYEQTGALADLEEALHAHREAVEIAPIDGPDWPRYLGNLGNVLYDRYDRTGLPMDLDEAVLSYRRAIQAGMERNPAVALSAAHAWGNRAFKRRSWHEASEPYQYGLDAIDRLFRVQLRRTEKETWLREAQGLPTRAAYALAWDGQPEQAVLALERGRTRLLSEAQARDRGALEGLIADHRDLLDEYDAVTARLTMLESGGVCTEESPGHLNSDSEIHQARAAWDRVVERIRVLPGYEKFLSVPDFSEIAAIMESGPPLAYLVVTQHGGLVLVVHPGGIETSWFDLAEQELQSLLIARKGDRVVGGYLPDLFSLNGPQEALKRILPLLGERVMSPLAAVLRRLDATTVTLIPTGLLALLPLHAARYAEDEQVICFLEEFTVAFAPSAWTLATARRTALARPLFPVRLVGAANSQPDSQPLPFAQRELEEITALLPPGTAHLLCGPAVTRANLLQHLPGATIAHFGVHSGFNPMSPLDSELLLAGQDRLLLRDVLSPGFSALNSAGLAVLSSCQTSLTDYLNLPDEVVGIASGFIHAGVPTVVASLWPVDDLATSLLMQRFYEGLIGERLSSAAALRQAQLWLRGVTVGELWVHLERALARLRTAAEERKEALRQNDSDDELAQWSCAVYAQWKLEGLTAHTEGERPFADPSFWAAFQVVGAC